MIGKVGRNTGPSNNCAVKAQCVSSCPLNISTESLTNISNSGLHSEFITLPALCPTTPPARFPISANSTTLHAVDQGAVPSWFSLFSLSQSVTWSFPFCLLYHLNLSASIYPLSSVLLSLTRLLQWPLDWFFCIPLLFFPQSILFTEATVNHFKVWSRHSSTQHTSGVLTVPRLEAQLFTLWPWVPLQPHDSRSPLPLTPTMCNGLWILNRLRECSPPCDCMCACSLFIHTPAPTPIRLHLLHGEYPWPQGLCTLTFLCFCMLVLIQ